MACGTGRGGQVLQEDQAADCTTAGDDVPVAFGDLCRRHGPAIHAYLARRGGRQTADDLFGEVWLQAYVARATYDPARGARLPWLYGIARNVLRGHWRNRHTDEVVLPNPPTDPWADADDRLAAAQQFEELRRALQRLGADEREVLLLVAWERLTPAEVADVLDIPQGTARSRLHRARHLMRAQIDPSAILAGTPIKEDR
jgi:RNA polymerase sigma-70 factor (ECF subfamily)